MIVASSKHRVFASPGRARNALARYLVAALIAGVLAGGAGRAAAQGAAPNTAHPPSQASILLAKQILQIKHADAIFVPLVRGVVIKTRDFFLQTNFMWGKDLNEVADDLILAPLLVGLVDAEPELK